MTLVLVCAVLLGRGVGVGVGDGNGEGDSSMEGLNRFWRRIPWGRRDEDEFRGQAQDREGAPPRCTLGRHAGRLWNWGGGRGDGGRCVGGERGRDENEDDREHRGQGGDGEEGRQAGELVRARDGRCGR